MAEDKRLLGIYPARGPSQGRGCLGALGLGLGFRAYSEGLQVCWDQGTSYVGYGWDPE